jgi:HPt (histidine-containing phosphotransfer) domain-containing protein
MIDWERVLELEEEVGKEDFDEVIQLFLEEVEERIPMLLAARTPEDLETTLHFLKGSALNLGFAQFSALCQSGETAASAGQTEAIDCTEIVACFSLSKQTFLKDVADHQAA